MSEPVDRPAIARRASYGPRSPAVGGRGARTRQRLLDAALLQFADRGFYATSIDDIARTAGVSRATLYQYFESRDEIATELLEECGSALLRVVRRLGAIGPTAEGYDNLHWWLGEWAYVYDKYATMFVQWAHIDSPNTQLRPLITRFVDGYTEALAERISEADIGGVDPDHIAIALTTVIERVNYYLQTQDIPVSPDGAIDTLAMAVQCVLFPDTPARAFVHAHKPAPARRLVPADRRSPTATRRLAPSLPAVVDESNVAAQRSIETLLRAGAAVFARDGYRASSVDQILAESGLSRRTFYKYFGSRLDLLVVLSDACAQEVSMLARTFSAATKGDGLSSWVASFVDLTDRDGGVLRIWIEEPEEPAVRHRGEASLAELLEAITAVVRRRKHPKGYNPAAAAFIVLALLERLPHQGVTSRYELGRDALVETITTFITRGVLGTAR